VNHLDEMTIADRPKSEECGLPRGDGKLGPNQHIHACPWSIGSAVLRRANHRDPVMPPHLPGSKAEKWPATRQEISAVD
jgi:hypothetical protein